MTSKRTRDKPRTAQEQLGVFAVWTTSILTATIALRVFTPQAVALATVSLAVAVACHLSLKYPADQVAPSALQVKLAEATLLFGVVVAGLLVQTGSTLAYTAGALVVTALTVGVIFVVGRQHQRLQPAATRLGRWVDAAGRVPPGTRVGFAALGAAVTVLATMNGLPFATLLGALVVLAPAQRHRHLARRDAQTRVEVETAMSGAWSVAGGPREPWSAVQARARRAPIRVDLEDGKPVRVTGPLPSGWDSAGEDTKTADIRARLKRWVPLSGDWTIDYDTSARAVVVTPLDLPTMLAYPGDNQPWNRFPLGLHADGTEAVWDVLFAPHLLDCGPTGSGKSVVQRIILFHALQHPEFRIIGIDMKRVEMSWLTKYPQVLRIAKTLDDAVEVLENLKAECDRRYAEMDGGGVNHFKNLPQPPPPILLMVDEMSNLMATEGVKTDEGKAIDELHGRARALVAYLARTSRAAGIFLCLATQRPDASILGGGELKSNLDCRVAAGRMDTGPSLMVLDSPEAASLPKIKGRGLVRNGGELDLYQGYFAEQDWYDGWLAETGGHVGAAYRAAPNDGARLLVLQAALDSGSMTDTDAQACGFPTVIAVVEHLAVNAEAVDEAVLTARFASAVAPVSGPEEAGEVASDRLHVGDHTGGTPASGRAEHETRRHTGKRVEPLPPGTADQALANLIGLGATKAEVAALRSQVAHAVALRKHGIGEGVVTPGHMVFVGPPGVGKTTVARIVGSLLRDAGVLTSGHVVEILSKDIKAPFVGQSGPMADSACDDALDGVLFWDRGLQRRA